MRFADRTDAIAPFFAMEFGRRAALLESRGIDVIKMSIGEPDFSAAPAVVEAMERAVRERRTGYTAALGVPALREAVAESYRTDFGVAVDAERVVVTAGASAGLLLVAAALVQTR